MCSCVVLEKFIAAKTNMMGNSIDKLVHLEPIAGVNQTCAEFVSEFLNKLNKVTEDVTTLVEVL